MSNTRVIMDFKFFILVFFFSVIIYPTGSAEDSSILPVELNTEYLHYPLTLETPNPRFSWKLLARSDAKEKHNFPNWIWLKYEKSFASTSGGVEYFVKEGSFDKISYLVLVDQSCYFRLKFYQQVTFSYIFNITGKKAKVLKLTFRWKKVQVIKNLSINIYRSHF